jgi:hypothetical protein
MSGSKLLSRQLDRRAFLGGAGFAAGAVVATSFVPLSIVHAVPESEPVALVPAAGDPQWQGHVDDACGHWPPYSYPIPYDTGRSPEAMIASATSVTVDPVDSILMV